MTLDDSITAAHNAGFWINNLFQLDDGLWQCNVRKMTPQGTWFSDFGLGETPAIALEEAQKKVMTKGAPKAAASLPSFDVNILLNEINGQR